jgi:hypothetical protein
LETGESVWCVNCEHHFDDLILAPLPPQLESPYIFYEARQYLGCKGKGEEWGVARGTQTKILGLRIHPKATEEVFEQDLNKELYELHVLDPSARVINTQLYERNGSRYAMVAMVVYETTSLSDPGKLPQHIG